MMTPDDQKVMQLWLFRLLSLLEEGDVENVKEELKLALGQIEEDKVQLPE
jgi:hypothetical protein